MPLKRCSLVHEDDDDDDDEEDVVAGSIQQTRHDILHQHITTEFAQRDGTRGDKREPLLRSHNFWIPWYDLHIHTMLDDNLAEQCKRRQQTAAHRREWATATAATAADAAEEVYVYNNNNCLQQPPSYHLNNASSMPCYMNIYSNICYLLANS